MSNGQGNASFFSARFHIGMSLSDLFQRVGSINDRSDFAVLDQLFEKIQIPGVGACKRKNDCFVARR